MNHLKRFLEERKQISKTLKLVGVCGEDVAPVAYVLAAIEQLQAQLATANDELVNHRKRVSELTSECLEVEGDISKAYTEINGLKAQLATAKEENKRLQKLLDIITKDNRDGWPKMVARIEENKRLRDEIRARRQWQTCPDCNRTFATLT